MDLVRLILIGLAAGFFSALFGVGGGIIIVPLLLLVFALEARVATATSLAAIGITAVSGVIAYAFHGDIRVGYAALVGLPAAASVAGATPVRRAARPGRCADRLACAAPRVARSILPPRDGSRRDLVAARRRADRKHRRGDSAQHPGDPPVDRVPAPDSRVPHFRVHPRGHPSRAAPLRPRPSAVRRLRDLGRGAAPRAGAS